VEAHNAQREMLGFPRLQALLTEHTDGKSLIDHLLSDLKDFTGEGWEQEDDVTLMTLQRTGELKTKNEQQAPLQLLWESTMASSLGNEQQAQAPGPASRPTTKQDQDMTPSEEERECHKPML
jgi:hypothetical protein